MYEAAADVSTGRTTTPPSLVSDLGFRNGTRDALPKLVGGSVVFSILLKF